jgi:putative acetyltransferase
MLIRVDDLQGPEIASLLEVHLAHSRRHSPPESIHALDLARLRVPQITFWTAWERTELLGCGALRELSSAWGELKSMHTAEQHRGRGVASAMLRHIIAEAKRRGYGAICLETGAMEGFRPSRELYRRFGFAPCDPFGTYKADPNSIYMRLDLTKVAPCLAAAP